MQGKNNGEEESKVKRSKEENRGQHLQSSLALLEHFRSPFFTCYIPFQISGSQESNASNRVRFGAEMRKIWPSEDNCSRDQSSHYDHEKDKFAYLSMRDQIELGKRQVQQSQWGSKYALNEDMSMKAKLASMVRRIEEFELRNVHTEAQPQAMPTSFEYNNYPNLTIHPQPQPSMSTSSLEQAILKISKVMEDFVGEQQKINSQLNEKIDNMESSINVRMEGVYNDLSLRIEKVQDSIEKLTNLDIARGKRKLPPQPHHNLQGTNAKISRKVLKIDTLVGDCYDNSMDQPSIENHKVQDDKGLLEPFKASTSLGKRRETNSLDQMGRMPILFGIQGEFSMKWMSFEVIIAGGLAKMMKGKEEKREFWPLVLLPLSGHIWSTFSSSFYTYYIPFRSSEVRSPTLQTVSKSELK
ncbi:hypothetical protein CK203_061959 [Vitis vinifera]|uniref:Uncharacterized protein n=1 Tax=Vitis vinifera TaxID=29760 RepID=A0A438GF36_VITVI|nr:hypothetical protein CK203_061959 [Vitis vinifera]